MLKSLLGGVKCLFSRLKWTLDALLIISEQIFGKLIFVASEWKNKDFSVSLLHQMENKICWL